MWHLSTPSSLGTRLGGYFILFYKPTWKMGYVIPTDVGYILIAICFINHTASEHCCLCLLPLIKYTAELTCSRIFTLPEHVIWPTTRLRSPHRSSSIYHLPIILYHTRTSAHVDPKTFPPLQVVTSLQILFAFSWEFYLTRTPNYSRYDLHHRSIHLMKSQTRYPMTTDKPTKLIWSKYASAIV